VATLKVLGGRPVMTSSWRVARSTALAWRIMPLMVGRVVKYPGGVVAHSGVGGLLQDWDCSGVHHHRWLAAKQPCHRHMRQVMTRTTMATGAAPPTTAC
jgi:hypothetical protein